MSNLKGEIMKLFHLVLGIVILVSTACTRDFGTEPGRITVRSLTSNEKKLSQAGEQFGFECFETLHRDEPKSNIIISPLSISMALGMTLNGADGETAEAMRSTLKFSGLTQTEINQSYSTLMELLTTTDPKVQFEIANSIWTHSTFEVEPTFIETNKMYFDAQVSALDFRSPSAPDAMNSWVNDKTHGKISKIVNDIDPHTIMYLINALYFYGSWQYEFKPSETTDQTFFVSDDKKITTPLMTQTRDRFSYFENEDVQAIDLPYGDGIFTMSILLPRREQTIDGVIKKFGSQWASWSKQFAFRKGTLLLPKFKLEYQKSLVQALAALGMEVAFSGKADFSRINPNESLFISEVLHKTFIDVNEKGTEAAAVTSVAVTLTAVGNQENPFYMRVDRPFLFLIREKTSGTILFMGKVINPKE